MLRFLAVLVPALLGAALVWFLIPVADRSDAGAAPIQAAPRLSDADKKVLAVAVSALIRSPRDLFGKPLQIITPDNQFTLEDLESADAKFLSRAYQECQLMMKPELRREYLASIGETDEDSAQAGLDDSQTATCLGVIRVMAEMLKGEP